VSGPRRGDASGPCPIGRAIDILGDRWTLLVLRNATSGMARFDEFKSEIGIADNILADRLRRLVEHGLLTKVPYRPAEGGRTRHEYRLTQAGEDVLPVLYAMMSWGNEHSEPSDPIGQMRMVHDVCGSDIAPGRPCPHCGRDVPRSEVAWIRPWRSDEPKILATAVPAA
jgi:DNA-binding HxlR family transcriptional regulator